jgi:hypothetical protein
MNKPPAPRNTEFSGNLTSMSFADVLQLLQVGRKTGYIASTRRAEGRDRASRAGKCGRRARTA